MDSFLQEIALDEGAIGYGSYVSAPDVRALAVKEGRISLPVAPSAEDIRSRRYPLSRYVYWHISADGSAEARSLCTWVLSDDGQLVVQGSGFEPLSPKERLASTKLLGAVR